MKTSHALGMVTACMLLAASSAAFAEDSTTPADVQPAVQSAPAPAAQPMTQLASVNPAAPIAPKAADTNPMHTDPHWPLFKNCIDNTATPGAFEACLQMAFMGVKPTDQVLALLTH